VRPPSLLACIVLLGTTAAWAEAPSTLSLASLPDEEHLSELLWEHSPDFAAARARVAAAQADVTRAHLLPNPEADLSWNTIPIGPTNPPGLDRLKDVPNYNIGLSELVELGKRGPRQDAARAALASAALDTLASLRARTYDVLDRAAEVAASEVRLSQLEALAADAAKLSELQRARQQHGDTAGLDVDRALLEEEQLQTTLGEERAHLSDALLACTRTAGLPCERFGGQDAAAAFLSTRLSRAPAPSAANIAARPDLRSLEAQEQSAQASLTLARRRWLPDPTVHLGYVHDQFVVSGNQKDSFFVGLSVPLTFFDHGQADAAAASASLESARQTRELLHAQAERDVATITAQLQAVQERRTRLREQTLPLAEGVVKRLDAAVRAGGTSLQDLILARRSYSELLLRAADLDLTAFHLTLELDRARATGPSAPAALRDVI
jgi:cobalt-zinc-cadmium efflux system outer membrane protein